jgi:hypothetical protein
MTNYTDYTDELEIENGDTLAVTVESDVADNLNGDIEITAQSGLASETICDEPGFEQETAGNRVSLKTEGGNSLTLVLRTMDLFHERDDVIGKIEMPGAKTVAVVTDIKVLD